MKLFGLLVVVAITALAQDSRTVTEPVVPPTCWELKARLPSTLADTDESKFDTLRIQAALDQCPAGGAVALKTDGAFSSFLTAPLQLRAGVTLLVDASVVLYGSRNPRDYDSEPGRCGTIDDNNGGCRALIGGEGVANAAVMGDGVIDGRGGAHLIGSNVSWWDLAQEAKTRNRHQHCPRLLGLTHSDNFILYRITLRNSANIHVSYSGGDGFTAWGVIIDTPNTARFTDGIDPANSTNVTITRCYIRTGDDNIAIKAGNGGPTSRMTIAHNHFYSGHGMAIGSETSGGAIAIRVTDLSIDGADNGLYIKSNWTRGGRVEDIVYEDICIRNTENPVLIDSHYPASGYAGKEAEEGDKFPRFIGILMRNVRVLTPGKITLDGYDTEQPLGVTFDDVILTAPRLMVRHADVTLGPGPVNFDLTGEDVRVSGKPVPGNAKSCEGRFVKFPDGAPPASR
jgi:polygalacturonase